MSQDVLISIRPEWCKLIASGKKTLELRKTRPRQETPFTSYIYCTQTTPYNPVYPYRYESDGGSIYIAGKHYKEFLSASVIGEFVCDEIIKDERGEYADIFEKRGLLTLADQIAYGKNKPLYGWSISNLVMFDEPMSLCEFETRKDYGRWITWAKVSRPPQSWMYVTKI